MAATGGVMPPPQGVVADFSGDRTELQNRSIVLYAAMTSVSTFVLGLRLYTRIFIRRMAGLDDILITLSWIGCIAWLVICFDTFQYGFGQHLWNVTGAQVAGYMKNLVGIITVYVWTPALTKLSLLALYHRLDPGRVVRGCTYVLAFLVFGYSLAITTVAAGPCNPTKHLDQECLCNLNLFMSIINILTDFFILCLPVPMLCRLQLPTKQKLILWCIFALGSGVMVISIVRLTYVTRMINNPDFTFNQAGACIFSLVEINGGVICACSVLLKPFIERHLPWIFSLSSRSGSRSESRKFGLFRKRGVNSDHELKASKADVIEQNGDCRFKNQKVIPTSDTVQGRRVKNEEWESTENLWAPDSKV